MGEKASINKQHEYAIKSKVVYDGSDFGDVPVVADYGSFNAAAEPAAEAAELASTGAEY